ncbi:MULTISPECIES: hypothetical protein [unclassified Brevundimonas]|uniref:hypothetical protein n=1 Tax=unclassified Brevundimonas TaxID=2622653 RepID=UPI003F936547
MNILLSALICGGIAGLGSLLVWMAHKHLGLSAKGQRIGQFVALILGIAVIRIVPVDQLSLRLQPTQTLQAKADAELFAIPAFKVLHDDYPTDYAVMRDAAVQSLKAGETNIQTINRIRPRLLEIFGAQMMKASDATIGRQLGFIVKQATFLQSQEPQYCHELLNTPGHISFDPTRIFPREMAAEEMSLMADILHETAKLPAVASEPIDEAEFQPLVEQAFARLSPSAVTALAAIDFEPARATTSGQKAASCHFVLGLMEEINTLPPADRARVFRGVVLAGLKSQS